MNLFFTSQLFLLYYCPLAWMFHSRSMNNKINYLQERCLRIVCSDKTSSFGKLLETDRSVLIDIRNLQILKAGLSKENKNVAPTIFNESFSKRRVQYNLCHTSEFSVPNVKSTFQSNRKFILPRTKNLGFSSQNCLCEILVLFDTFSDILDVLIFMF